MPQIITGVEGILRNLNVVDFINDLPQYIAVANTFPGSYSDDASVTVMEEMAPLYESRTCFRWRCRNRCSRPAGLPQDIDP